MTLLLLNSTNFAIDIKNETANDESDEQNASQG